MEIWFNNWRIRINELKSKHVTFTLRKGDCPPVFFNNIKLPHESKAVYLGIHLDRRLTWRSHIEAKRTQIKLKTLELNWLIGSHSKLSLDNKVTIYKSILKPIWTYGIQLYGYTSSSNIELIQRAQSKILRTITRAPWYIRNENIHKDLQIPFVKDEFKRAKEKYILKLEMHPNSLARQLSNRCTQSRLRRADKPPMD